MLTPTQWQLLQVSLDAVSAKIDNQLTRELGISSREYMMLRTLATQFEGDGGHFRMKNLALAVGLSTSATTRLMNRLEERGLLSRYICATDRRGMYADVSALGLEILAKAEVIAQSITEELRLSVGEGTVTLTEGDITLISPDTVTRSKAC